MIWSVNFHPHSNFFWSEQHNTAELEIIKKNKYDKLDTPQDIRCSHEHCLLDCFKKYIWLYYTYSAESAD